MNKTVTLSSGAEVECFTVPIWMTIDVQRAVGIIEPERPVKKIKSIAGHVEEVPYGEGDEAPEWIQYQADLKAYQEEEERFTRSFMWDTGVVRWRLKGNKKFVTTPPKDYVVPPVLERVKMFSEFVDARRVAYIKYTLLANIADTQLISEIIYGGVLLSSKEVDDAVSSFQD